MKNIIKILAIFYLGLQCGQADPKIYSPIVKGGELAVEIRGNTTIDNDSDKGGSQRHVFELEYGLTDWWKTAIVARLDEPVAGSLKYDSTAWENIFQLTEQGQYWLDAGVYLEYKLADESGVPDKLESKLLLEKQVVGFVNTLNLTFEKEIGAHREESVEFEYAWRTRKKVTDDMELGIEAFGELGEIENTKSLEDQTHRIGPVFYHEIEIGEFEIEYSLAWLFGLTEASPDNTFRWQIEIPFD
jgi:hypothetical protein